LAAELGFRQMSDMVKYRKIGKQQRRLHDRRPYKN
jgi:hypothetical protein